MKLIIAIMLFGSAALGWTLVDEQSSDSNYPFSCPKEIEVNRLEETQVRVFDASSQHSIFWFPKEQSYHANVNEGRVCFKNSGGDTFGGNRCYIASYKKNEFFLGECQTQWFNLKCRPMDITNSYAEKLTIRDDSIEFELWNYGFSPATKPHVLCSYKK